VARPPLYLWRVAPLGDEGVVDRVTAASGRWHRGAQPIVYASTTPELAALEALAHLRLPAQPHWLIRLRLAHPLRTARVRGLSEGWKQRQAETRDIGQRWLESGRSSLLYVPSALVPEGVNALIASEALQSRQLRAQAVRRFRFDRRLVRGAKPRSGG
jgi:RES domain-containing protein